MEIDLINGTRYQGSTNASVKPVTSEQEVNAKAENQMEDMENPGLLSNSGTNEENPFDFAAQKDKELMKKSISEINSKLNRKTECIFGIHEKTDRVTIKIVDRDSKEVLKEIPPERTLEMLAKIWEFAGILVDEKR